MSRLLLTGLVLCTSLEAQVAAPERFQAIRRSLLAQLVADSIPSLSLAIAKDGQLIWEEAFGYLDRERRVPATTAARYPIASVSKPLTATALMVLVEQGRLALDDPLNPHLAPPGITAHLGSADDVTLRRVAGHTSGLSRHDLSYYSDEAHPPLPMEERIQRYAHIHRVPGESYEYSNLGYQILAHVIARRSERPFGDFLREAVLDPLGMRRTSVGPPRAPPPPEGVAPSYDGRQRPIPIRETIAGAGGVYSTAGDLVLFGLLHLGRVAASRRPILSPAALAEMRVPHVQTRRGEWYALGWNVNRTAFGVETIYHSGSNGGSASILAFVPSEDLVVAVLANCVTPLPGRLAQEVIASFGPHPTPDSQPTGYPSSRVGEEPYRPMEEWTGQWEGTIQAPDGAVPLVMEFMESGAILVRLATARADTASGVRIEDGFLRGSFSGEIANPDVMGRRYRLHFKLRRAGDRVTGSVTAGSVAGERVITLSYWTDLRRAR